MILKNRFTYILALVCGGLSAQTAKNVQLVLSDIPFWPKDGVIAPDLAARQFVYYDISTDEIVISYPATLAGTDVGSGQRITFRYEPQNLVAPDVQVNVQRQTDGQYSYTYSVANQSTEKRAIRWFSLVVPSTDDTVSITHPEWATYGTQAPAPGVAPQAGLYSGLQLRVQANMGKFVAWGPGAKSSDVVPGTSQGGFRVSSRFRPGITTAYFYTGKALRTPESLPPAVADQLLPLLKPEVDYKGVLTVAPKYGLPFHDTVWIASDLAYGIHRMISGNLLTANSPFVVEMLAALDVIGRSGKAGTITLKSQPAKGLEQEIANAVSLSLQ